MTAQIGDAPSFAHSTWKSMSVPRAGRGAPSPPPPRKRRFLFCFSDRAAQERSASTAKSARRSDAWCDRDTRMGGQQSRGGEIRHAEANPCLCIAGHGACQSRTRPLHFELSGCPGRSCLGRRVGRWTWWDARWRRGMSDQLGVPVVVENRPGANNALAAEQMSPAQRPTATPCSWDPTWSTSLNPFLYPKLGYDPIKGFTPHHQLVWK